MDPSLILVREKVDHEDSRSVRLGIGYSGLRSAEYDRPQRHAPRGLPEF